MATQKRKGLTYAQVATKWDEAVNQLCAAKSRIAELEKAARDAESRAHMAWATEADLRVRLTSTLEYAAKWVPAMTRWEMVQVLTAADRAYSRRLNG